MFHFHSARLFSWRMTRIEEFLLLRGRNVGSFGHFEVSSHKQGSPRYFKIALSISLSCSLSQRDFLSERKRERKSDDMILPPGGQGALLPRTPVSDWKSFYFVECYLFIYLFIYRGRIFSLSFLDRLWCSFQAMAARLEKEITSGVTSKQDSGVSKHSSSFPPK